MAPKDDWMEARLNAFSEALDKLTEGLSRENAARILVVAVECTEGALDGVDASMEDRG